MVVLLYLGQWTVPPITKKSRRSWTWTWTSYAYHATYAESWMTVGTTRHDFPPETSKLRIVQRRKNKNSPYEYRTTSVTASSSAAAFLPPPPPNKSDSFLSQCCSKNHSTLSVPKKRQSLPKKEFLFLLLLLLWVQLTLPWHWSE